MSEQFQTGTNEAQDRYFNPQNYVDHDFDRIYKRNEIVVGQKQGAELLLDSIARDHTIAINGVQLGDEGKGRLVDNKLSELLKIDGVKQAYVVRYQGGSNAGHTVFTLDGVKIPLHQLPSSVNEEQAIGLMDSGMVIHMEDVKTEIEDAEAIVGDLRQRVILSEEAKLCTDLERAEEIVNRFRSSGQSAGGTGRGISPTYGNDLTRLGKQVKHLFEDNWRTVFEQKYDRYEKEFAVHGYDLATMDVPDLRATRDTDQAQSRKVGTKDDFLDRLEAVRQWYIDRDASMPDAPSMIQNTFLIHQDIYQDLQYGVLFEGAQAIGLHRAIGRLPDVTSSDTSVNGVIEGTKHWRPQDIKEKIGVFKIPYMSSVGHVTMATHIDLPREEINSTEGFTDDQRYGERVRREANEKGTTTHRYRDICALDLEMMRYNVRMGGIESLAGTHLDIAWEGTDISVCTHYVKKGTKPEQRVPYQPGVEHQEDIEPRYTTLPGWDGEAVQQAQTFDELPENAIKFLAFIQAQVGVPIIAATTGPERKHMVEIPEYAPQNVQYQGV